MPTFSVRVTDATAQQFDAAANGVGGRSALLRQLIEAQGGSSSDPSEARHGRPLRMMVRLADDERSGVVREAAAMGLRPSAWVAALVRHRVHGSPRFSAAGELSFLAIQGEVHRIGINVNQIARALNTAIIEGRVVDLEVSYLDDLRQELRGHLRGLAEVLRGNLAYWDGDA